MKKIIVAIVLFFLLSATLYLKAKHFWRGEIMSAKKVCKKWGGAALNVKKFKEAKDNESVRAKMACDLLKNQKQYIGKSISEIREIFGPYSGYYFSDMFPTYFIEIARTRQEDSWQIVFLIDRKDKISEIIVHKNCCDK